MIRCTIGIMVSLFLSLSGLWLFLLKVFYIPNIVLIGILALVVILSEFLARTNPDIKGGWYIISLAVVLLNSINTGLTWYALSFYNYTPLLSSAEIIKFLISYEIILLVFLMTVIVNTIIVNFILKCCPKL